VMRFRQENKLECQLQLLSWAIACWAGRVHACYLCHVYSTILRQNVLAVQWDQPLGHGPIESSTFTLPAVHSASIRREDNDCAGWRAAAAAGLEVVMIPGFSPDGLLLCSRGMHATAWSKSNQLWEGRGQMVYTVGRTRDSVALQRVRKGKPSSQCKRFVMPHMRT
jgi:hypothetical protein